MPRKATARPAAKVRPRAPKSAASSLALAAVEPAPQLTAAKRKELRAAAHALEPIVQVGHAGLHAKLIDAVSRALRDHELIKVRFHEPEDKHTLAELLASETRAALCGLVGHTAILYKPRPKRRDGAARREPTRSNAASAR